MQKQRPRLKGSLWDRKMCGWDRVYKLNFVKYNNTSFQPKRKSMCGWDRVYKLNFVKYNNTSFQPKRKSIFNLSSPFEKNAIV